MEHECFESYVSSPLNALYSTGFFEKLTFNDALYLQIPPFAPRKSLIRWVFSDDPPSQAESYNVQPTELVPHPSDLLPISLEMRSAYDSGKKAVVLVLRSERGEELNLVYHFSKVCIIFFSYILYSILTSKPENSRFALLLVSDTTAKQSLMLVDSHCGPKIGVIST
jgi:hypothetical protein